MSQAAPYLRPLWVCLALLLCGPASPGYTQDSGKSPQAASSFTLNEVIALAEERNPSLAGFPASIDAVRGDVLTARAYPNPTVNFLGDRGKPRGTESATVPSGFEHQTTVMQHFEWPQKRAARIEAANTRVDVAKLDAASFRLLLRAETKNRFYQILLAEKQADLAAKNLATVKELRRSVEIRVRTGESPAFELVKAEVEVLKAQKDVNRAKTQVELARAALNALLGNALPASFRILGDFSSRTTLPPIETLMAASFEKHPTIQRQRREVERWQHQLRFERQARIPDVGIGGTFLREIDKDAAGAVLSIPVPLWDRRRGQIATATAEGRRAEAELNRLQAELRRSIFQEYQNYQIAVDQLGVFETGLLKQAQEALRIARISFRQGASGLLDFLDAQRVLRSTLQEYNSALYDLAAARVELERASGGELSE